MHSEIVYHVRESFYPRVKVGVLNEPSVRFAPEKISSGVVELRKRDEKTCTHTKLYRNHVERDLQPGIYRDCNRLTPAKILATRSVCHL